MIDSVEAGSNIIHYIIVILTEFRNNTYSYPDHEFDSFEETKKWCNHENFTQ